MTFINKTTVFLLIILIFLNSNCLCHQIIMSFVLVRHGARTNGDFFSKKMFPKYSTKQLTQKGLLQMKSLGKHTIESFKQQGFIISLEDTIVSSSPSKRTILSIKEYLKGAFGDNDYPVDYKALINQSLQLEQQDSQPFLIQSISIKKDYYFHAYSKCQTVHQQMKKHISEFKRKIAKYKNDKDILEFVHLLNESYLKHIDKQIDAHNLSVNDYSSLRDLAISAKYHGKSQMLPKITDKLFLKLCKIKAIINFEYKFKSLITNQLATHHVMLDLLTLLQYFQKNKKPLAKLVLISLHDNFIVNWLHLFIQKSFIFEHKELYKIPYASQIMVNLIIIDQKYYIQMKMNDQELRLKECNNDYSCPLNDFIAIIQKHSEIKFNLQCNREQKQMNSHADL